MSRGACGVIVFLVLLTAGSCERSASEGLDSLPDPYPVVLVGNGKRWQISYPTAKDGLPLPTDFGGDSVRIPAVSRVELIFKSADYIYTFAVPECAINEVAVPELEFSRSFVARNSGEFELISDPMCGEAHSGIQHRFIIEPPERFIQWLSATLQLRE